MIFFSRPERVAVEADAWKIQTPCRLELLGPSGVGKSRLMLKLVKDDSVWQVRLPFVIYCAPTLEDRRDYLEELKHLTETTDKRLWCTEGLPPIGQIVNFSNGRPTLLLVDDVALMSDLSGLNDLVAMHGRHLDISAVFALQSPFLPRRKDADFVAFSRNMTGRFIFNQRGDQRLNTSLNMMLFPDLPQYLKTRLDWALDDEDCNYCYVDTHPHPKLPSRYMLFTRMFSNERVRESPVFYDALKYNKKETRRYS